MYDYETVANIRMGNKSEETSVGFGGSKRLFDYSNGNFTPRK
jgi:hypothetical protein